MEESVFLIWIGGLFMGIAIGWFLRQYFNAQNSDNIGKGETH